MSDRKCLDILTGRFGPGLRLECKHCFLPTLNTTVALFYAWRDDERHGGVIVATGASWDDLASAGSDATNSAEGQP